MSLYLNTLGDPSWQIGLGMLVRDYVQLSQELLAQRVEERDLNAYS